MNVKTENAVGTRNTHCRRDKCFKSISFATWKREGLLEDLDE